MEIMSSDDTAGDHISEKDRRAYVYTSDLGPVRSRDFADAVDEALTLRHLAARESKLDLCDACPRAKALRLRQLHGRNEAESRIQQSRGPPPEKIGAQVTLDHITAERELSEGYEGQTAALTLIDRATNFRWGRGLKTKEESRAWK
jgi:hypothetical protein